MFRDPAPRAVVHATHPLALHRFERAEKVAAEHALRRASASLDLQHLVSSGVGGPDPSADHIRSWDEFLSAGRLDAQGQDRLVRALDIKRRLLRLTAALEREADPADLTRKRREELARRSDVLQEDPLSTALASSPLSDRHSYESIAAG